MKYPFCAALLTAWLMAPTPLRAQPTRPLPLPYTDDEPAQNWIIKFAPLSIFDPDNTIQFGAERLLGRRNAVQLEVGYGFQGMNLWQQSQSYRYTNKEVWRGRAEWRYYTRRADAPVGNYVALEVFYKQVNVRESGTVGVGCLAGPCQYYQIFNAPLQKFIWGSHLKLGGQYPASTDRRLLIDYYIGMGFRNREIERFAPSVPDSYYYDGSRSVFDSFRPLSYAIISMTAGLKVGYSL